MNQLDLPVMFDMKTVAKILSVSRSTVYELLRTEQLDAVRIGRARRVSQNQLNSFINRLEGM
jgi:excisionase family DNA binding protein